jgi:L-aspartate oxidase
MSRQMLTLEVHMMKFDDVLIVGSGVAALQLAVSISRDLNVRMITKSELKNANSYLAQGGIAAAIGVHDNPSKHFSDTIEAGRFHNDEETVRKILNEGPELIYEISRETDNIFDKDSSGNILLGMEGAHSEKRIVHSGGDATGKNLVESLISRLKENVIVEENVFAYELMIDHLENRCIGVKAKHQNGTIHLYYATSIILATGGCGQLYSFTSAASTVTGDGIAMAYLAGAEIADMEFIQFHPTLLYKDGETKGLISEAVRGEGAILVADDGTSIMDGVHPYKDLAPRHIVSQTIYDYIQGGHEVYLDISSIAKFEKRFPSITSICKENGINLSKGKIPVVPGSHFLMGGIKTDVIGRTSLTGLFAIGEASCTGLHGANRLASNSLLEGLYQGKKLSEWINSNTEKQFISKSNNLSNHVQGNKLSLPEPQILKQMMMNRVGIVRTKELLDEQLNWLNHLHLHDINHLDSYSTAEITTIFMYINAKLITEAAIQRTESRGGHFRSDYPNEDNANWYKKIITHKCRRDEGVKHEYSEVALGN